VETLAKQYWHARQAGDPVMLSDGEMETVLARFQTYGKQGAQLKSGDAAAVLPPERRDIQRAK
jgi:L-fuculose-phosphate aldolase